MDPADEWKAIAAYGGIEALANAARAVRDNSMRREPRNIDLSVFAAMAEADPLLKPSQVAHILNVRPRTVVAWTKNGRLPAVHTATGQARIRTSSVQRLLDDLGTIKVQFRTEISLDLEGRLVGVEMVCAVCGDNSSKTVDAIYGHARYHQQAT